VNKDKIETIFRSVGLMPEERLKVGNFDVFLGDGFVSPSDFWKFRKFPNFLSEDEFSLGAYVTLWWVGKDENCKDGGLLACEPFHERGYDLETKKKARLQAALKQAEGRIDSLKKAGLNG
jgi:hypothetical protein